MKRKNLIILAAILTMAGCSSVSFVPMSDTMPLPDDCKFLISSSIPASCFERLGVIKISEEPGKRPKSESEFRSIVAETVCGERASLVIPDVDGMGEYVGGTVYRLLTPSGGMVR